jgi:hypothetical protein
MCGASGIENKAFQNEVNIESILRNDFTAIFGKNTGILDMLEGSLAPQVQGGPGQYGFTPAEDAARRGQATEQLAQAGTEAANAVRSSMAAQGGGNTLLPSGSQAAIDAALAQQTATRQAEAQMGITQQGYDVGRENYYQSLALAGRLPGELENPATTLADPMLKGAGMQMQGAQEITQANNAWIAPVAGLVGAGLNMVVPGLGSVATAPFAQSGGYGVAGAGLGPTPGSVDTTTIPAPTTLTPPSGT